MGCIFEHETFRFAKMILRDRCCTSYDLASPFRDRRSTLDRWSGKIANSIGTRPSASALKFPCSKQARRIAVFLMLSTAKNEEVLQNFASFLTLSTSKLRKSRRLASFLMSSSSKLEEVS